MYHGIKAFSFSRDYGYFANKKELYESYHDIAEYINGENVSNVGLWIGGNSFEYPLLQTLNKGTRIEHVNVTNDTAIYIDYDFSPDVIFATDVTFEDEFEYNNVMYSLIREDGVVALYAREEYHIK
jgi:hypothetical protein